MNGPAPPTDFGDLVAARLGARPPERLSAAVPFSDLPPEARRFIRRMLALMQRAAYPVTEFNAILVHVLSAMIPNMLPHAWEGRIPPITHPDRHRKLDTYVAGEGWANGSRRLFLDLGCGFPPVTTADTASRFSQWRVIGVDRAFARYMVTDPEGNYACFDRDGRFQYFQAMMTPSGRRLYQDAAGTRDRFSDRFGRLRRQLAGNGDGSSETVSRERWVLVANHLRDFESGNLSFLEADIADLDIAGADVIRCMNVLVYAAADARRRLSQRLGHSLRDGGLLIAGTNGPGVYHRYTVYEKRPGGLAAREFAFSIENLRPFGVMPWFSIHDDDPEAMMLADLMGAIRNDAAFWPAFDRRVDALLAEGGVCRRGAHGYLDFPDPMPPATEIMAKTAAAWRQLTAEGYLDGAVAALARAGHTAWVNRAGDIAVAPES